MKALAIGLFLLASPLLSTADPRSSAPVSPQAPPRVTPAAEVGPAASPFAGTPKPIFLETCTECFNRCSTGNTNCRAHCATLPAAFRSQCYDDCQESLQICVEGCPC